MATEDFPDSVRSFVERHIRSIEQLEILLLLRQSPERWWSVQGVYDVILSTPPSVQRWLDELVAQSFIEFAATTPASYRYSAQAENAVQIDRIAEAYGTMPVRVIEAIYKPTRNPAQGFADAFRLRPQDPK